MKTTQAQVERIGLSALVLASMALTYFLSGPRKRKSRNEIFPEQQRELDLNLITPANATFGLVWPVIYTGTAALAVHQALPSQLDNPRYRKAAPWLAVSYVLNAVFGYFFSSGRQANRIGASITTLATLPPAIALHEALEIGSTAVAEPENTLRKSISLYTGWLTLASVISVGNLLVEAGWRVPPKQAVRYTEGLLFLSGELATRIAHRLNDPFYLLPFVAGFVGIASKQATRHPGLAALAAFRALSLLTHFAKMQAKRSLSYF